VREPPDVSSLQSFFLFANTMNVRCWVAFYAALGVAMAFGSAKAQSQAVREAALDLSLADAVELKNGGYLRGFIVEFEPASHLSLRMPDGRVQRFPIVEIKSAERAGRPLELTSAAITPIPSSAASAPNGSAMAGASSTPPAAVSTLDTKRGETELDRLLAAVPGPRIQLDASADQMAYLQRVIGDVEGDVVAYHLVCKLPCRVKLPAGDSLQYRIANSRLEPTDWFKLPNYSARARAHLVSDMWPLWPRAMLVGGVTFGIAGGTFLGINALGVDKTWVKNTGLALAGVSGAFFIASGLLWLLRPESSLSIERAP